MTQLREFVLNNFKTLAIVLSFAVTMYVQHVTNIQRINELTLRCSSLELKIEDQYEKIDAIKLDKAVFEATMTQFTSMRSDLKEIRTDMKEEGKSMRGKVVLQQPVSVSHVRQPPIFCSSMLYG